MRMQVADENVSLRSLSDELVRLVGRRGFEELKRGFVGVPVAGTMVEADSSLSDSGEKQYGTADGDGNLKVLKEKQHNLSFSDLLNSGEENASTIAQMVARVGRWWYSRCYEAAILPDADLGQSIWHDEQLLRECEKWGTSFRLLICYAQKPEIRRRRTVSV